MSEYDSKRYFWLKLKEDFFDDDAISWLEEQNNGKEYALFYLKLCLKSLKNDGVLIRKVGNILVPYDTKKIGEITRTDEDTVIVAMELLKKIGLIELQENGALYMTQLSTMIGSETNGAERKRRYREAQKKLPKVDNVPQLSQNCPEHFPLELEKELEKELECRKGDTQTDELQPLIDFYQANIEILTPFKLQDLQGMYEDFGSEWLQKAMEMVASCEQGKRNNKYLRGVLKGWKKDGVPKPWENKEPAKEEQISGAEFMRREEERHRQQVERDMRLAAIARQQEEQMRQAMRD
jgi:predicted phage replisome organizer